MKTEPKYLVAYKYDLYEDRIDTVLMKDLYGRKQLENLSDCKAFLKALEALPALKMSKNLYQINIKVFKVFRTLGKASREIKVK